MKRNIFKAIVCMFLILATVATPISASASSMAYIMKVNAYDVRMREEAGDSEVIEKFDKGDKVIYWGEREGSYYKVGTSSGETGYIYKDYLATYGAMKLSSVYVTTASTQMYNRSGSSLKKDGRLASGKYVMVYKTSGNWAYIKTMSGKGAFIQKGTVKKAF